VLVVVAAAVAALIWSGRSDDSDSRPMSQSAPTTQPGTPTSSPRVGTIEELSGIGDKTSDVFTAEANWEIRWKSPGKPFAIELLDKGGVSRGEVVQAGDRAEGATFVSEAGEFKLKVTATGEWSIEVIGQAESG